MEKKRVKKILKAFNAAYYGPSWHGDHTKRILEKLTEKDMTKKIGNSHTILELILHIINWRHYVMNCLAGNPAWQKSQEENFTAGMKDPTLGKAIKEVENTQEILVQMIFTLTDDSLDDLVDTHAFTYQEIVYGLINHDLYHLGQINLIVKYA